MIPKIHKKGTSFRGAAAYLLHDVGRATTSERVAWVETRNLPVSERLDDLRRGDLAWRLMAATALDQERIKQRAWDQEQAQLPEEERQPYKAHGGRKSHTHVLHITLSWAEHEAAGLTKAGMLEAVEGALACLGEEPGKKGGKQRDDGSTSSSRIARRRQFADEHQALIVCHNDGLPHVHILLNRVHAEHGVMLPTSKEQLLLSRWAQSYEESRGKVLCEQRRVNNRRREQGDHWSQGTEDRPRHLYEIEEGARKHERFETVRREQKSKDHALAEKSRRARQESVAAWEALAREADAKRRQIRVEARANIRAAQKHVRDAFDPRFAELGRLQEREREDFAQSEESLAGRVANAWRNVDWKGLLTSGRRSPALREAFGLFAGGATRRSEALRRRQQAAQVALEKEQASALKEATQPHRRAAADRFRLFRNWHVVKRQELEVSVQERDAHLREEWRHRRAERKQAWQELRQQAAPSLRQQFGISGDRGRGRDTDGIER